MTRGRLRSLFLLAAISLAQQPVGAMLVQQKPKPALADTMNTPFLRTPITLDAIDLPFERVIRHLRSRALNRIMFDDALVREVRKRVTYHATGVPLATVLRTLLEGTGLEAVVATSGRAIVLRRADPVIPARETAGLIVGNVVGPDSLPVHEALVVVTLARGMVTRQTRTNVQGQYGVVFNDSAGDYGISISKFGLTSARLRVKRPDNAPLVAPVASLKTDPALLSQVNVVASRDREAPSLWAEVPGKVDDRGYANGWGPPSGNLADIGDFTIGMRTVADGISAFGLPASQNTYSINGATVLGVLLPRSALVSTFATGTSVDFSAASGATIRGQSAPPAPWGYASIILQDPRLQWGNRSASRLGLESSYRSINIFRGGEITDRFGAIANVQVARQSAPAASLLRVDRSTLELLGISQDSVTRLLAIASGSGIPIGRTGVPTDQQITDYRVSTALHYAWSQTQDIDWWTAASRQEGDGLGMSATALPTGGSSHRLNGAASVLKYTNLYPGKILGVTTLSFSRVSSRHEPYLSLPGAEVAVTSALSEGEPGGLATLQFGGSGSHGSSTNTLVELRQKLFRKSLNKKHQTALEWALSDHWFVEESGYNEQGTFTFNSIDELAANIPALFTRMSSFRPERGEARTLTVAASDTWWRTKRFSIIYGVGAQVPQFLGPSAYNPTVESLFDRRTDFKPRTVEVSPQGGFTWHYGTYGPGSLWRGQPRGTFRGVIGMFQSGIDARSLASTLARNGLGDSFRALSCVGADVPTPEWTTYELDPATIPQSCAGGTAPILAGTGAPSVALFAPSYRTPQTFKARLHWTSWNTPFHLAISAEGWISMHQASRSDLNMTPAPVFRVTDENMRPVFVNPATIAPGTGAVSLSDSRRHSEFGEVVEMRSDARSKQRTLTVQGMVLSAQVTYLYQFGQTFQNGFSAATSGDPFVREWGRSEIPRHEVIVARGIHFSWVDMAFRLRAMSGQPFTPLVSGDPNGDGRFNDAAFIFDPSSTLNAETAKGMNDLLRNANGRIRSCLRSQLGKIAARGSCQGPWTGLLDFTLRPKTTPNGWTHWDFEVINVLGGVDQLLHGARSLRGWGGWYSPDAVLLHAREFDAASQRFRYDVNPLFGSVRAQTFQYRQPVQLHVEGNIRLSESSQRHDLRRVLWVGRGAKARRTTVAEVQQQLRDWIGSPVVETLTQEDSLLLSNEQVDRLHRLAAVYARQVDSASKPFAEYVVSQPNDFDFEAIYRRHTETMEAMIANSVRWCLLLKEVVSPMQWAYMPWSIVHEVANRVTVYGIVRPTDGWPELRAIPAVEK